MTRQPAFRSRAVVAVLLALLALPALSATEELSELNHLFAETAQRLDEEIRLYETARERERDAIGEFVRLNKALDDLLADPNTSRQQLVRHEAAVAAARDLLVSSAAESATFREAMYELMRTMAVLVSDYEREGVDIGPPRAELGGTWRAEVRSAGIFGLFGLHQERGIVHGSYRLSNGARGSVQGTFSGGRLRLKLVDSERGPVGSIEGVLELERDEISGTWQALDLSTGRPSSAGWSAERLTIDDVLDFRP